MQIMPGTWRELRSRCHLGVDPYDPHDNILVGTAYIRELHDHCGVPGFLAAYSAGTGRYERHLATGRALTRRDPGVRRRARSDHRGETDRREDRNSCEVIRLDQ